MYGEREKLKLSVVFVKMQWLCNFRSHYGREFFARFQLTSAAAAAEKAKPVVKAPVASAPAVTADGEEIYKPKAPKQGMEADTVDLSGSAASTSAISRVRLSL